MSKTTAKPLPPASGWKRMLSFFVIFWLNVLIFFYLYVTGTALVFGDPPHAQYYGNSFNLLVTYAFFGGLMILLLKEVLHALKSKPAQKNHLKRQSLFGLEMVVAAAQQLTPSTGQRVLFYITLGFLLTILYLISPAIGLFAIFFQVIGVSLFKSGFDTTSAEFLEGMSQMNDVLSFQGNYLYYVAPALLVVLLHYVLLFKTWRGRGLPELVSGITIVQGEDSLFLRGQLIYIGTVLVLTITAYPYAQFLENNIERSPESFDRIISIEPQREYLHPAGWSMLYDDSAMSVNQHPDLAWTSFLVSTTPSFGIGMVTVQQEDLGESDLHQFVDAYFTKYAEHNVLSDSRDQDPSRFPIMIEASVQHGNPDLTSGFRQENHKVIYFFGDEESVYVVAYEKYIDDYVEKRVRSDIREHGETAIKSMISTFRF